MNEKIGMRLWAEKDLALLQRLLGDPLMTEHIGGPETPEQILHRHERYCQSSVSGKGPMFVILFGDQQISAGSIGYWETEWQGQLVWETGWSILPEFQGKGIATQATTLIIERARAEGTHRFLHAFPAVDNIPSNSICRKAGFFLQGEVNFEYPPGNLMRSNDWRFNL
ncbi:MAG: GNAT family N-acetyltransferase [Anaerolineales bacterium]